MLRAGKRFSISPDGRSQFADGDRRQSRRVSRVVLPPSVAPLPLVNDQIFNPAADRTTGSPSQRRRSSVMRRSSSVGSLHGADMKYVYLVDPSKGTEASEQKERMLQAMLKYDSPRFQKSSSAVRANNSSADFGRHQDLPHFRAFSPTDEKLSEASYSGSSSSSSSGTSSPSSSSPPSVRERPASAHPAPKPTPRAAVASPRATSALPQQSWHTAAVDSSPRRAAGAPPTLFVSGVSPRSSVAHGDGAAAAQRRKSLKTLLTIPTDVLSGLGGIEETLQALDDDRKLLGLEEQAEAMMSARGSGGGSVGHRHHGHHGHHGHSRSHSHHSSTQPSPRRSPEVEIAVPTVPNTDFQKEVDEALQHFTPLDTLAAMLSTVRDSVEAISVSLTEALHTELATCLKKQQKLALDAIDVTKALVDNAVMPKAVEQTVHLQTCKEELVVQRRATASAKNELSKIQTALRQYGIVPAKWGVMPPSADSCVLLCCDFPAICAHWSSDPSTMASALKLIVELERKMIKEMKVGYEAENEGDRLLLVFPTAKTALDWGLSFQAQLVGLAWPQKLLDIPAFQADSKLMWRGAAARMVAHRGGLSTQFDPQTQSTAYYGEALHVATLMMQYCTPGVLLVSDDVLHDVPNLRNLATHGGGFGVSFSAEVAHSTLIRMTKVVPYSLRGRLERATEIKSDGVVFPTESAFLMTTLRPSDVQQDGLDGPADDANVHVAHEFGPFVEEEEEQLKHLAMCVNVSKLTDPIRNLFATAEAQGQPVVTMFVQIPEAARAFEKHRPSLIPTIRTLLQCVKRACVGLNTGTDVAVVGETVSLVFASRTESATFLERFLQLFSAAKWHRDTVAGWKAAFPGQERPVPGVAVGAHLCKLVRCGAQSHPLVESMSMEGDGWASETGVYQSMQHNHRTTSPGQTPRRAAGAVDRSTWLDGYAANFDVACALAAFALPGEAILSDALCDGTIPLHEKTLTTVDLGPFSIQQPKYDGNLYSVSLTHSSRPLSAGSNSRTVSALHSSVAAEGAQWPHSSTMEAVQQWLPLKQEIHHTNQRAMISLLAERSINQLRRPPAAREAVFVAVEAWVPSAMWSHAKKFLVLEALKSYHRCIRSVLTDLEDGYEVFVDPQCFFLAFQSLRNAFKFAVTIQDKLAGLFWPPAFVEEFKQYTKRISSSEGGVIWSGLRVRVGLVTPPVAANSSPGGETFSPVTVDTLPLVGSTMYFGHPVQWCTRLCAAAKFGQTLIDQETMDRVMSLLPSLGSPITQPSASVGVPGRDEGPLRTFSVRSQLLKHRVVDEERSHRFDVPNTVSWYSLFTKEETPVQYMMMVTPAATTADSAAMSRIGRSNSLLPFGLFDERVNSGGIFGADAGGGSHANTTVPPSQAVSREESPAANVAPLPSGVAITPRTRRPSMSVTPTRDEGAVDMLEYVAMREELLRCHRTVRRMLDLEQLYARGHLFKESMREFRSDDDFVRLIVQTCRDLGIKWSGDSKSSEKAFVALSNAALPVDVTFHSHTPGQTSRTTSFVGGSANREAKREEKPLAAAEITTSIAAVICHFHTFFSRATRVHRKPSLLSETSTGHAGSDAHHGRARSSSRSLQSDLSFGVVVGTRRESTGELEEVSTLDLGAKHVDSDTDD